MLSTIDLINQAVAELKQTTVGHVNKHWKTPPPQTHWFKGLDLLRQAVAAETPPPPPPPPPPPSGLAYLTGSQPSLTISKPTLLDNVTSGYVEFVRGSEGSIVKAGRFGSFNIWGASSITLDGAAFDGGGRTSRCHIHDASGSIPKNIKILGCSFRNFYTSIPGDHYEALFIGWSDGGVIENCTFENNGNTAHVFFTWWGEAHDPARTYARNWTVRNNVFRATHGAYFSVNMREEIPLSAGLRISRNQQTVAGLCARPEFLV